MFQLLLEHLLICDIYPVTRSLQQQSPHVNKQGPVKKNFVMKKKPNRCVAGNCGNFANTKEEIILHKFPFFNDEKGEAKRRRKKWVDFVKAKQAKWQPKRLQDCVLGISHLIFYRADTTFWKSQTKQLFKG